MTLTTLFNTNVFDTENLFPCNKSELLDFAERQGCPQDVLVELQGLDSDVEYDNLYEVLPCLEELMDLYYGYLDAA